MSKYLVTAEYPYSRWCRTTWTVEATSEEDARAAAMEGENNGTLNWDESIDVGDGEAGDTEIVSVELLPEEPSIAKPDDIADVLSSARTLLDMINHWDGEDEAERVAVIDRIDTAIGKLCPEESSDEYPPRCSNPGGHKWNRSAGEADEARLSGDYENDSIRCVYCGADGDA
jgi:hypothetical protein